MEGEQEQRNGGQTRINSREVVKHRGKGRVKALRERNKH